MQDSQQPLRSWKLVVSDMDGTLLNDEAKLTAETIEAVQFLKRQSIGFTVATGRMDRMIRTYTDVLDIDVPVIACNGAVIRDVKSNRILWHKTIPPELAARLVCWLQNGGYDYLCYTPDQVFYPRHSKRIWHFERYNAMALEQHSEPVELIRLEGRETEAFGDLIKILAVPQTPEQLSAVKAYVSTFADLEGVSSMADAYDIMADGVSKGDALQRLSRVLAIDLQDIVVIGDNDNDVSMMDEAGLAIAMVNGTPAAKAISDVVTIFDHNESGLAKAMRDHVL